MNATSAGERGGGVALVDGGSLLLGSPGAPGCTTTGLSVPCRASTAWQTQTKATIAANNAPRKQAGRLPAQSAWPQRLSQGPPGFPYSEDFI